MKVVTYNIQFGLGKDGRNDLQRIADSVVGADIIALQEVERHWAHTGQVDQPALLAEFLPEYFWVYSPYFDVDASHKAPDGIVLNARRQFGNMVLSKYPIASTRLFPLPKSAVKGQRTMAVGMQEAVVMPSHDTALRIYNTHLSAKSSTDRKTQISLMRQIIATAPSLGAAWTGHSPDPLWQEDKVAPPMPEDFMLVGDFNHGPDAPEYSHLVQPDNTKNTLFDCWTLTGHPREEGATFHPAATPKTGTRLDFAFVDQRMKDRISNSWIDTAAQGSDHQPYWIEIDDA